MALPDGTGRETNWCDDGFHATICRYTAPLHPIVTHQQYLAGSQSHRRISVDPDYTAFRRAQRTPSRGYHFGSSHISSRSSSDVETYLHFHIHLKNCDGTLEPDQMHNSLSPILRYSTQQRKVPKSLFSAMRASFAFKTNSQPVRERS